MAGLVAPVVIGLVAPVVICLVALVVNGLVAPVLADLPFSRSPAWLLVETGVGGTGVVDKP